MSALVDAARDAGITYRQADHWVRSGYITINNNGHTGSGYPRNLDDDEADILTLIARLVRAGLTPATAAKAARRMVEHKEFVADLGNGLGIVDALSPHYPL